MMTMMVVLVTITNKHSKLYYMFILQVIMVHNNTNVLNNGIDSQRKQCE